MKFYDDHDLRLLSGCITPHLSDIRLLPRAFGTAISILNDIGLPHVVVGRLALARYCRAQYTELINVRLLPQTGTTMAFNRLSDALQAALPAGSPMRCDITPADAPIEQVFAERSIATDWLDTRARLATPEHLLWLALSSEELQAGVDAVHLIQSGHIDLNEFHSQCRDDSPQLLRPLARARRRAKRTSNSTYSASVERRLAGRTPP